MKIGSSSCLRSTTSNWTKKGNYNECFSKRFPLGHWSFLGPGEEDKWYGKYNYKPEGRWNTAADLTVANFQRQWTSSVASFQCVGSGILEKRKGGRCTIQLSAEPSDAELSFRTIHSATRLSICGAVANWCEELAQLIPGQTHVIMENSVAKVNDQLCHKLEPQEVDTLVQILGTHVQAARDRLRVHQERFERLSREIKVPQICESAGFMRKVSIGQYFKTIHDVEDGFGGKTQACREYTSLRDHQDSEPVAWIGGHTKIGPVLQVKVICCLDQYGIEIQVPSTKRDGSNFRIVKFSGPNRYVDESWHDQDNSPENGEMVGSTSVGRPHPIISSIEETHASQPQAQSNLMNYLSKDRHDDIFCLWYCRKAVSVVEISKMVLNLVRHRDLADRETDGAVH